MGSDETVSERRMHEAAPGWSLMRRQIRLERADEKEFLEAKPEVSG